MAILNELYGSGVYRARMEVKAIEATASKSFMVNVFALVDLCAQAKKYRLRQSAATIISKSTLPMRAFTIE